MTSQKKVSKAVVIKNNGTTTYQIRKCISDTNISYKLGFRVEAGVILTFKKHSSCTHCFIGHRETY